MTTHQCKIIAYTYAADYHCIDCTNKAYGFGERTLHRFHSTIAPNFRDNLSDGKPLDREGNPVYELFDCDEWQELDEWFLRENPTQYLACADCHEIIDEYTAAVA